MNEPAVLSERLYDKIGGWLVLPAFLHPVVAVIGNIRGSYEVFQVYSEKLPYSSQVFIFGVGLSGLLFAVAWIVSAYLAGTLNTNFPKYYIWLTALGLTGGVVILLLTAQLFNYTPKTEDYKDLGQQVLAAMIWVPYMLISKRVRATFFGIPMPTKALHSDVNSPLRRAIQENREPSPTPPENLTMVQRLGMVLYWTAVGIAVALLLIGVFAIFNARSDGAIIGGALIASAAIAWLIGRACKYIFVGK